MAGSGALQGLRLIEIGTGAAAEVCSQLFADHGCEVIRVQPLQLRPTPQAEVQSRNKRHIALELNRPRGRGLLQALLAKTDFLVLGSLSVQRLQQEPPLWLREILDPALVQMHLPDSDGPEPGFADALQQALFAAFGAMMGLHHRYRAGEGQIVRAGAAKKFVELMAGLKRDVFSKDNSPDAGGHTEPAETSAALVCPELEVTPGGGQRFAATSAQTDEVLAQVLGLDEAELVALRQDGAI